MNRCAVRAGVVPVERVQVRLAVVVEVGNAEVPVRRRLTEDGSRLQQPLVDVRAVDDTDGRTAGARIVPLDGVDVGCVVTIVEPNGELGVVVGRAEHRWRLQQPLVQVGTVDDANGSLTRTRVVPVERIDVRNTILVVVRHGEACLRTGLTQKCPGLQQPLLSVRAVDDAYRCAVRAGVVPLDGVDVGDTVTVVVIHCEVGLRTGCAQHRSVLQQPLVHVRTVDDPDGRSAFVPVDRVDVRLAVAVEVGVDDLAHRTSATCVPGIMHHPSNRPSSGTAQGGTVEAVRRPSSRAGVLLDGAHSAAAHRVDDGDMSCSTARVSAMDDHVTWNERCDGAVGLTKHSEIRRLVVDLVGVVDAGEDTGVPASCLVETLCQFDTLPPVGSNASDVVFSTTVRVGTGRANVHPLTTQPGCT